MATPKREYIDIIIEDEDLAAWMTTNNTFIATPSGGWSNSKHLWNGVLIQLGDYQEMGTPSGTPPMALVQSVKFEQGGTTVKTLTRQDFTQANHTIWINVVAKSQSDPRNDPMGPGDLAALRVTQPKSLRYYFNPFRGGITFWQNRNNGYTIKAMENANGGLHNSFTFRFQREDDFSVEIYDIDSSSTGATSPQTLTDIDTIRISAAGGPSHGSQQNPPIQP